MNLSNTVRMNIWIHSLLSAKKFGGEPEDYYALHKFIDSSKLYYFHLKHRALLHNTYGIDLSVQLFGDIIRNSKGVEILVRDLAAEHIKEDLSGKVPTLLEWFGGQEALAQTNLLVPEVSNDEVYAFLHKPFLQTNLKASYIITASDFGVYLMHTFFNSAIAMEIRKQIPTDQNVQSILSDFSFKYRWQFSPDMKALDLIKDNI